MRRSSILAAAIALLCAPHADAGVVVPGGFVVDTLLSGLDEPTAMAFLPDGRLLITEQRTGKVRLFVNGHVAATDPVLVFLDNRANTYERGLVGVAVDPGWPGRPYAYFYYTRIGGFCRLVRYRASGDLSDPAGENLAFGDSLLILDDIPDNDGQHNAGCLRFGPGNHLFVSIGDDRDPCGAADSTSLKGEVLRLDLSRLPDGPGGQVPRSLITPAINPLSTADSNARLVWAYGLRNPWRFGIDQMTGAIYLADVGDAAYDELNEVLPGDFLGWPYREGPLVVAPYGCQEPHGSGRNDYKGPLVVIPHGTGSKAINTAGMYRPVPGATSNWPAEYCGFFGDVFYGDYFAGYLRRLKRVGGVWSAAPPVYLQPNSQDWATGVHAAVDFQVGPDGSLWWISQFDELWEYQTGSLRRIRWTELLSVDSEGGMPELRAGPNPFRSATRIVFRLPARERVTLVMHDVGGRRVRTLIQGEASAGESSIEWDGRTDAGRPLAPGLYFARFARAGEPPRTVRIVRIE